MVKVDSDIDVEENMSFVGPLRNYILMKPWSFRSNKRNTENRVNKIDERALRLVYDEPRNLPFEGLLVKSNSVSIYIKKIKIKKIYIKKSKARQGKIFQIYYNSKTNHTSYAVKEKSKTVYLGTDHISCLAPKIWKLLSKPLKNENCLSCF